MIDQQYDFLNDRIDHEGGRIDDMDMRVTALESDKEVKKAHTMEIIVIVLIIIEIVEALVLWHYHG